MSFISVIRFTISSDICISKTITDTKVEGDGRRFMTFLYSVLLLSSEILVVLDTSCLLPWIWVWWYEDFNKDSSSTIWGGSKDIPTGEKEVKIDFLSLSPKTPFYKNYSLLIYRVTYNSWDSYVSFIKSFSIDSNNNILKNKN